MMIDCHRFQACRILVIGDLMIDEYLWGNVERISPEAPVQVVSVEQDSMTLGGAGNVVNNLVDLGAHVAVAGVIGAGAKGDTLLNMLKDKHVNTDGLIHISELAHHRVKAVTDILKEGDEVTVKVLEIDRQGKIRLSRKALLEADHPEPHQPGKRTDRVPKKRTS